MSGHAFPAPSRRRLKQVPQSLPGRMGGLLGQWLWGAQLGTGLGTFVSVQSFWILIAIMLNAGPTLGAITGFVFAFSRQGVAVWLSTSGLRDNVFAFMVSGRRLARLSHAMGTALGLIVAVLLSTGTLDLV